MSKETMINFHEDGRAVGADLAKEARVALQPSGFCMHTTRPEVVFEDEERESITLGSYIEALGYLAGADTIEYFNGYSDKRQFVLGVLEVAWRDSVNEDDNWSQYPLDFEL